MTEPEPRRRRRAAISCSLCRTRKIRCDRGTPCNNCRRSRNGICVYGNQPSKSPPPHLGHGQTIGFDGASTTSRASTAPSHPSSKFAASSISASTLASQASAVDVDSLKRRINELEEQLSKTTPGLTQPPVAPTSSVETTISSLGGTFDVHQDTRWWGQAQNITRGIMHKNRLFGQSHWVNGIFLFHDLFESLEEPRLQAEKSRVIAGVKKCKALGKVMKSQWRPPWPSLLRTALPPKDVADELVDCYLRTIESCYRILHVPSFRRDYEALWVSDTQPDATFMIQLKLVLAIGATTYDELFSMRAAANQWVYEAQNWASEPEFKSRLSLQSMQNNILLLLARETTNVGGSLIWVSAGSLFRAAVYTGLHRDPSRLAKKTVFLTEMRRRIWNTILEICLQSSITSGGPPFLSLSDFDTQPPGNFDDDQLVADDPVPKPESDFTGVSTAIALRKTFPQRLAIAKFLNDLNPQGTYEETLRIDAEIRASYKILRKTLQGYASSAGPSPSQFEIRMVDFLMHCYLSSLHVPFFGPSLRQTTYAYSRKVVIDIALKIWCAAYPSSAIMAGQIRSENDRDDLARLATCGSGLSHSGALQACLVIALELRAQLQEEESLNPVPLRPDLFSVLEEAKVWTFRCIEAGETNMKGYLLTCVIAAQIQGLAQGLGRDEFSDLLIKTAEEAGERCLPIFKEKVARARAEGTVDGFDKMSLNETTSHVIENWDFTMMDDLFNLGGDTLDPMNWLFDGEAMQEPL